jgi:hypothetical protein
MRGKKGSGHFEMIVGFVFFITFVFFLFLFISPWDNLSLPKSALDALYASFASETMVPLSSVFVKTEPIEGSCFYIRLPKELFRKQNITDEKTLVTRLGGDGISSEISGDNLRLSNDENFFRVAISPEFNLGHLPCATENHDFELGGVVELDVVSYFKLLEMKDNYTNNYIGLKRHLKVADIFDFAIVIDGIPEARMEPENGAPDSVEILAKEYVVKVLKFDGAVSNERISIRIW